MGVSRIRIVVSVALAAMLLLSVGSGALAAKEKVAEYELTIVNLTPGQPMGGTVWAIHPKKSLDLFKVGKPASDELGAFAAAQWIDAIVEEARTRKGPLLVDGQKHAFSPVATVGGEIDSDAFAPYDVERDDRIVAGGVDGAARAPSYLTRTIHLGPKTKGFVTVLSALPCLNDGFAAAQDLRLPKKKGQYAVSKLIAYDAGVEGNTEDFADLPPHCTSWLGVGDGLGSLEATAAQDGAEGLITEHAGVQGSGDLDPVANGFDGSVGLVIIKNLGRKTIRVGD